MSEEIKKDGAEGLENEPAKSQFPGEPNSYKPYPGSNQQPAGNQPRQPNFFSVIVWVLLITTLLNVLFSGVFGGGTTEIGYSQFTKLVDLGYVDTAKIEDDQITISLAETADLEAVGEMLYPDMEQAQRPKITSGDVYYTGRVDDAALTERLDAAGVDYYTPIVRQSPIMNFIISWVLPFVLIIALYSWMMKRMMRNMGGEDGALGSLMGGGTKSKAKEYNMEQTTGVTFADVAGQDEAKESLMELVDYLHDPVKYQKIGAKQPKGALLVGPPGTGKTLLAKAVAGEANVPFFSISGSEFVEMFVGLGAKRVRELFAEAQKKAPCIIFIDEIDAIGKSRDSQLGGNDEREQTLNQLLAEMDGFDSSKGIVILAATNRPEILDKALLRPGRFDRRVIVEKPDLPGREAILKVHAAKVSIGPNVDLREIALATSGATGADLANMINEAALRAVRLGRHAVLQEDLMEAVELVIAGKEKKDRVMNKKEREMVAYHEVGHALATALQKDGQPVQKITIVPRTMGSLGYTMNMPEEERYLLTRSELLAEITTLLGGRAAEKLVFGEVTTGASNDIERATKLARSMVTQYGMSEKFGPMGLEQAGSQYLDGRNVMTCSEQTGGEIDGEVREILDSCQATADVLLRDNRAALEEISMFLLEKENITGAQFMELLNKHKQPQINKGV